ncbi:MAG: hypothetical protein Q8M40_12840 [Legionella sp.]|nr:hypothetical protein [Legionella sp.]
MTFYDNYLTFLNCVYNKSLVKFEDLVRLKSAIFYIHDPLSLQDVKIVLASLQEINEILDNTLNRDLLEEKKIIFDLINELKITSGNEEITESDMREWLKINYNVARILIQAIDCDNWLEHELDLRRENYEINREYLDPNPNINRFQFASRNTGPSLDQQVDEANELVMRKSQ